MWGRKKSESPVPAKTKLIGELGEIDETLVIDDLTTEILKNDLNIIRQTHTQLVKHLSVMPKIFEMFVENKKIGEEIVESVAEMAKNLNEQIGTLSRQILMIAHTMENLNLSSNCENCKTNSSNSEKPQTEQNNNSSKGDDLSAGSNPNEVQTENLGTTEIFGFISNEVQQADNDGEQISLFEKLKDCISSFVEDGLGISDRRDEGLSGLSVGDYWFVALPAKEDGTYDASVLQLSAFGIIKRTRRSDEKVIAVYDGVIKEKNLLGARKVATEQKIVLTSLADLTQTIVSEKIILSTAEADSNKK